MEIFRRLLVGSEGTLGFVAEAVSTPCPTGAHTTPGSVFSDGIDAAAAPVPALVDGGRGRGRADGQPDADRRSYALPGVPESGPGSRPRGRACSSRCAPTTRPSSTGWSGAPWPRSRNTSWSSRPPSRATRTRRRCSGACAKGCRGSSAPPPPGSTFIIEDVCVPPARIAESARDIQALLGEHEFLTGVAGHASAGNLHFLLTPNFSDPAGKERYDSFMTGLVDLVVERYDGSLKAEHGTGRSMAPYVEREWGAKATALMWRIKELADPSGVLDPDVVLSRDPDLHLRNLKSFPRSRRRARRTRASSAGSASRCARAAISRPPRASGSSCAARWRASPRGRRCAGHCVEEYAYDALDTCAADGSCKLACPLGIDTGALVKDLRAGSHSARAERTALRVARHYAAAERAARAGLRTGGLAARCSATAPWPR